MDWWIGDWWIGGLVIGGLVIGGLVIGLTLGGKMRECSENCASRNQSLFW